MSIYDKFLCESPHAGGTNDYENKGNYPFPKEHFQTAFDDFQRDYEYKDEITTEEGLTFQFYKKSRGQEWCGITTKDHERISNQGRKDVQTRFFKIFWINLTNHDNIANQLKRKDPTLNIKKLYNVDAVNVNASFNNELMGSKGIAKAVYEWFVEHGYNLMGDAEQYFGARRLWAKLSEFGKNCTVHIIDIKIFDILEKNVVLKRPSDYTDSDERYYSSGHDKNDIRPILVKMG